mmetsp:Transcript_50613/g.134762  ORF Transcript_50613/g.134762 Transcript_50613/m.134762 type:complete len:114 (+) Transcript_50613:154-495(+)
MRAVTVCEWKKNSLRARYIDTLFDPCWVEQTLCLPFSGAPVGNVIWSRPRDVADNCAVRNVNLRVPPRLECSQRHCFPHALHVQHAVLRTDKAHERLALSSTRATFHGQDLRD